MLNKQPDVVVLGNACDLIEISKGQKAAASGIAWPGWPRS